jgi:hypothetical protein
MVCFCAQSSMLQKPDTYLDAEGETVSPDLNLMRHMLRTDHENTTHDEQW